MSTLQIQSDDGRFMEKLVDWLSRYPLPKSRECTIRVIDEHAPDIADELATALRDVLAAYISAMSSELDFPNSPWLEREGDKDEDVVAARSVLRRYDDSRKEHGNGD